MSGSKADVAQIGGVLGGLYAVGSLATGGSFAAFSSLGTGVTVGATLGAGIGIAAVIIGGAIAYVIYKNL